MQKRANNAKHTGIIIESTSLWTSARFFTPPSVRRCPHLKNPFPLFVDDPKPCTIIVKRILNYESRFFYVSEQTFLSSQVPIPEMIHEVEHSQPVSERCILTFQQALQSEI